MKSNQPQPKRDYSLPEGFRHAGITYDLKHLKPFDWGYQRAEEPGKPAVTFRVHVRFSHHCFTRGLPANDKPYDSSLLFLHLGEVRLFNQRRWALSRYLPDIVKELPLRECQHANNTNFVTIALVDENGNRVDYEIYFRVRKSDGKLRLNIESAYVRDSDYRSSRPKGKRIRFLVILHNVLTGKPIRP